MYFSLKIDPKRKVYNINNYSKKYLVSVINLCHELFVSRLFISDVNTKYL